MATTWQANFATDTLAVFDSTTVSGTGVLAVVGGRLHSSASTTGSAYGTKDVFGASGAAGGLTYLRFYLKETSGETPNANNLRIVDLLDTTGAGLGSIWLTNTRQVEYQGGGWGGFQSCPLRPLGTDTWHLVEFFFTSTIGQIVGRLDGAWFYEQHGGDGGNHTTRLRTLIFGAVNVGSPSYAGDLYLDHLYVSDDITTGWPGPAPESGTPPKGGVFVIEGFEHASIIGLSIPGDSDTPTIDSAVVRSGTYSLKCGPTTNPAYYQYSNLLPQMPELVMRFGVRVGHLSSGAIKLVRVTVNGGFTSVLSIDSSGVVSADIDDSDGHSVTGPTLAVGQWYAFDVAFRWLEGTWALDWRYRNDGTGVWTDLTSDSSSSHSLSFGTLFKIGMTTNAGGSPNPYLNLDDVVLSSHGFDYPFEKGSVWAVSPNVNGTHNTSGDFWETADDGSTTSAISASAWDRINDIPIITGASADAVAQSVTATAAYLEFGFTSPKPSVAAGASQLTVFTRLQSGTSGGNFRFAYSDGTYETITKIVSSAPEYDSLKRHDFPMTLGVGSSSALPHAWTDAVLSAVRMRYGYSDNAGAGTGMRCDMALIQSIYNDAILNLGALARLRLTRHNKHPLLVKV